MIYTTNDNYTLYHGKMQDELQNISDNTIDSIVTDPPYELGFMGKSWDSSGVAFQKETWEHCLRVLKPGGYLLAFGGSRTYHRIACAIEDAGFEIRDTIMWLYGSGFPKSMNIGLAIDKRNGVKTKVVGYEENSMPDFRDVGKKQKELSGQDKLTFGQIENSERKLQPIYQCENKWSGWGTALKPAFEPIIVARKPFTGSLTDNIIKYGVGGINIDECRVGNEEMKAHPSGKTSRAYQSEEMTTAGGMGVDHIGRFPANIITDGSDDVAKGFPNSTGSSSQNVYTSSHKYGGNSLFMSSTQRFDYQDDYNADGSAMRYFYSSKASKKDRDEGLERFENKQRFQQGNYIQSPVCSVCGKTFNGTNDHSSCGEHTMIYKSKEDNTVRKNIHPTVKPTSLMQYLVRLVTPKGGTVLDPFMGSGSTGKATMFENKERNANYKFIGIEMTEEYLPICKGRIDFACKCEIEEPEISLW